MSLPTSTKSGPFVAISASQFLCHLWLAWLFCPSCVSPIVTAVPIRISQTLQADFLFLVCVALNKLCQGEQVIRAQPMRQILVDEPEVHFLSKLVSQLVKFVLGHDQT